MSKRLETGVYTPPGDWPGVFIRGDDALGFAVALQDASLREEAAALLIELLQSCRQREGK